jgi:hypothetical protein
MTKRISIAKDFSRYPAGREKDDGDWNGERFRNDFLVPSIEKKEKITVLLDGTRGYGSSFLEEAFGGLVRLGFDKQLVQKLIELESKDQSLIEEIEEYIQNADL